MGNPRHLPIIQHGLRPYPRTFTQGCQTSCSGPGPELGSLTPIPNKLPLEILLPLGPMCEGHGTMPALDSPRKLSGFVNLEWSLVTAFLELTGWASCAAMAGDFGYSLKCLIPELQWTTSPSSTRTEEREVFGSLIQPAFGCSSSHPHATATLNHSAERKAKRPPGKCMWTLLTAPRETRYLLLLKPRVRHGIPQTRSHLKRGFLSLSSQCVLTL